MENEDFVTDGGDAPLDADEALKVLAALEDEGETGTPEGEPEGSGAPDAAADEADSAGEDAEAQAEGEAEAEPDTGKEGAAEGDGSDAVVLARDGKHTIPYEKLQEARQGWQQASAQVQALQQQLEALKAAQQAQPQGAQAAQAAQAAEDGAGDGGIFGDFSEEALAKGIERLVAERVAQAVQPLAAREQDRAMEAHMAYIHERHPNINSILQSREFDAWVKTHPARVQEAIRGTFAEGTGGTAEEICEVLDAYVKDTGKQQSQTPDPSAAKAAAKSAIARTAAEPPSSLSSIPGGRVDGRDLFARMDEMSGEELYAATESMTPEQMEAWLARAI